LHFTMLPPFSVLCNVNVQPQSSQRSSRISHTILFF
jgi:hypothetical protein